MRKRIVFTITALVVVFMLIKGLSAEKQDNVDVSNKVNNAQDNKPIYAIVGGREQGLTPFPNDESTRKILVRSDLQKEGSLLASMGFYEEALVKFKQSMDPSLFNSERDVAGGLAGIVRVYKRMGKFEEALKTYQWFLGHHLPENEDIVQGERTELLSLLEFQKTESPKPVYDHIAYLRKKYKKYIPPQSKGDSGFHSIPINTIIHLYNWMGDANGGIRFMEEVLSSREIYPAERAEYERVKAAFEEDKRNGQKGHLQKVIETSDYIGW